MVLGGLGVLGGYMQPEVKEPHSARAALSLLAPQRREGVVTLVDIQNRAC